MIIAGYDSFTLFVVMAGALLAGFTTGFAGFGTGLVASGLWLHVLPAPFVPPLVALGSVAAQIVGFITVRKAFNWRHAAPLLAGGMVGVPLGVWLLRVASSGSLQLAIGIFLIIYALIELVGFARFSIGTWGGSPADGGVGVMGGILGGFAGLSGPLPFIWLQLRGGAPDEQRAVYQPFNLLILGLASIGMGISGQINKEVLVLAVLSLPLTLAGAVAGVWAYRRASAQTFRRVMLFLLLGSGLILVGRLVGV